MDQATNGRELMADSMARVVNASGRPGTRYPVGQYASTRQPAHPPLGHRRPVEIDAQSGERLDARSAQGLVRAAFSTAPGPDDPDARLAWRSSVHHDAVRDAVRDLDPAASGYGLDAPTILHRLFGVPR